MSIKKISLLVSIRTFFVFVATALLSMQASSQQTIVHTETQATSGKQIYELNCASCHGLNLGGATVVPNLSGPDFAVRWSGVPINQLASQLRRMPPGSTAGLEDQDYEDITAYILDYKILK